MSRLLTQEEVDALLAAIDFEDEDSREHPLEALYDLRAPVVLAGDRLALFQAACERLAEAFGEGITQLFGGERRATGAFTGLVQQPCQAVIASLPAGSVLGLLALDGESAAGAISLQPELALALVDRAQGGAGLVLSGPRRPSPVETRLLEGALETLTRALARRTPLAGVALAGLEVEPETGALVARGGTLCSISIRVVTDVGDAMCRVLLTPTLVQRLLVREAPAAPRRFSESFATALRKVPVRVSPVITGAVIRLGDLVRLRPGDVLELDRAEGESAALRVNGAPLLHGRIERRSGGRVFAVLTLSNTAPARGANNEADEP